MISEAVLAAVLSAVITGVFAVLSNLFVSRQSSKDLYSKLDKQSELADQRIKGEIDVIKAEISSLKASVDKHNQVIERTYDLERNSAVHSQEIASINHEIRDLKQTVRDKGTP